MKPLTYYESSVTKSSYPGSLDYRTDRSTLSRKGGIISHAKTIEKKDITPGPSKYTPLNRAKSVPNFTFNSRGKTNVDRYSSISFDAPSCEICAAAWSFFVSRER